MNLSNKIILIQPDNGPNIAIPYSNIMLIQSLDNGIEFKLRDKTIVTITHTTVLSFVNSLYSSDNVVKIKQEIK